jgi:hypothetical protein
MLELTKVQVYQYLEMPARRKSKKLTMKFARRWTGSIR